MQKQFMTDNGRELFSKKVNGEVREATLGCDTTGTAGNLNFTSNTFYSEFTNHLTLTDTALALPDMQGSGMVYKNNLEIKNVRRVG